MITCSDFVCSASALYVMDMFACCRCPPYCSDSRSTSRIHASHCASSHSASHGHGKRCLYWPAGATDHPSCSKRRHWLHSTPHAPLPTSGQSGFHQTLLYSQDGQPHFHPEGGHYQPQNSCSTDDGPTAGTGE